MDEPTPETRRLHYRIAALEAQCEALGEPPAGTFGAYLLQELSALWNQLEEEVFEAEYDPRPYLWPDDESFPWSSLREFVEEMRTAHTGLYGQSPALWAKYIAGNLEGVAKGDTGLAGNLTSAPA